MKKLIVSAAAAAVTAVSAAAAPLFTASDLRSLSGALLGQTPLEEGQDVNGDGRVDAFDLVLMRRAVSESMQGSGEFAEVTVPAAENRVRYIGRTLYQNDAAWLVQSGAAVEFTVTGKSAEVTILGDSAINNDEKYRPRYAVIVDGEIILDELMETAEKKVTLFSGDSSRTAAVKVIHLSEANNGTVGVSGITVNTDVTAPVVPTAKKDLSIEFIGDSITCAYGVEGADQYESFMTSTENFMKSYAYLTAQKLNADYSAVSYSGYGILSGYTNDGEKNTDSLVPDNYGIYGKPSDYAVPWDFDSHPSDVVVINLGTNDDTYVTKDFDTRSQEFTAAYTDFLSEVRSRNPDAYIVCTLGTMGCTELYPCIETAVSNFRAEHDDRITSYQSETHTQADGMGSDWHPSEKTQQYSAYVLADKICQALGMDSDRIGLNAASDAQYSVTTGDGTMMSDYFSDWDHSYHVTVVNGGSSPDAITAHVSGIALKKGGRYTLSFSFTADEGAEIPFTLGTPGGKTVFSDTLTGTGSQTQYTAEFTAEDEVAGAELTFLIGGKDSMRFSLYTVKVIRTE